VLLGGNDALFLQGFGALKIDSRLLQLRSHQRNARLRSVDPGVKLVDRLARALEHRLGLVDLDVVVARIERQQQLPFLNGPVVLDVNVGDGAGYARGNQRYGAVNVRVVGGDVAFEIAVVVKGGNGGGGDRDDHHYQQYSAHELRVHRMISEAGKIRCISRMDTCYKRLSMTNGPSCQMNCGGERIAPLLPR